MLLSLAVVLLKSIAAFDPAFSIALACHRRPRRAAGPGGGSGSFFNVDVSGPLGIGGNARYSGRANPNLPAIIRGHVYLQDLPVDYGMVGQRGIPNALIILDNGLSERTDATGSFEFHFVTPGRHSLSIEPGTLPSGLIPDEGAHLFDIRGGQIASFDFTAEAFAGLTGRLLNGDQGSRPLQRDDLMPFGSST